MVNAHDKVGEPIQEDLKFDPAINCAPCPSYKIDFRYFYVCSHDCILMFCNECVNPYDVFHEAGLSNESHKISIEKCFYANHRELLGLN